jgi:hypothetical protein
MPLKMRDFQPGLPVALTLTSLEPKDTPSQFGPEMVFQSTDGPVYLSVFAANQIAKELEEQAIRPGDPIHIIRKGNMFRVMRAAPAANGNGNGYPHSNGNGAPTPPQTPAAAIPQTTQTSKLMGCFMQSIDAITEAQAYADRKGLKVTFSSEDVRSTAIACWISACKGDRQ